MNHFQQQQQQQQTHVAQQSRREKLRIPGSLHPSSPQSGNNASDHSAGSQAGAAAGDQENYTGVLPGVYNDAYSFAAGSELLAAYSNNSSKAANGFSDIILQQQQQQQQGQFSNLNLLAKNNWSSSGNLSSNPLSIAGGGSTNANNSVAATLLSSLQGVQQPRESYLTAGHSEAMQLFQLTGYTPGPGGYSDPSTPGGGSMVLISPSSVSSSVTQGTAGGGGGQQHFIGIPLTPDGGSGIGSGGGFASAAARGTFNSSGNWRSGGDEFLFLPSSEATNSQRKALEAAGGSGLNQIAGAGDLSEYNAAAALRQQQQQQSSLSSMLGQQLQQGGHHHRVEIDNSHPGGGVAGYQSLSLSLSNQNAQLQALDSGLSSPDASGKRGQQQQVKDLSHFRSSPRDTLSAGGSYPQGGGKSLYFEGGGGVGGPAAVPTSFNFVTGSRYLRAAQQLLDEVCSVGRGGLKQGSKTRGGSLGGATGAATTSPTAVTSSLHGTKEGGTTAENSVKSEITMGSSVVAAAAAGEASPGTGAAGGGPATNTTAAAAESKSSVAVLTPEERQEYEGKKTKLLAMLQEVDRRYRQYYDQMQIVITSFDAVAGAGAATPYTALALQAMSRYFRCLRDAITTQIQTTCKSLGEEDVTKSITSRPLTSRLRFIDQQIRQQRAYQQYGMLQQHAWRPQRGLPERSVSILRAWLFEHFLHPYPKDADKMMLARQTGLTRGQVSNWFINARVRLWKPMVEEMYQEEIKEQELGVASARLAIDPEDKHQHHHHHHHDGLGGGEGMMSESRGDMVDKMQLDHHSDHHQGSSYSDYSSMMMRKPDSQQQQMFGDSESQMKKTRLGIHDQMGAGALLGAAADPVAAAVAAGMDVDLKTDPAGGICIPPERHYMHEQYVHPDNFQAAVAAAARYGGAAGFGSSPAAAGFHQGSGGGVSLTLGLRNCDNLQQQIQHSYLAAAAAQQQQQQQHHQHHHQQNFLAPRNHHHHHHHHHLDAGAHDLCNVYENAGGGGGGGLNAGEQEGIDYQGRKQQQMESHLLHDFVA